MILVSFFLFAGGGGEYGHDHRGAASGKPSASIEARHVRGFAGIQGEFGLFVFCLVCFGLMWSGLVSSRLVFLVWLLCVRFSVLFDRFCLIRFELVWFE